MKFTDRGLRALKPKAERYEVWEDNGKGLGLRVSPTGRKTFIFLYRYGGRSRRLTLGTFGRPPTGLTLADAHLKHAEAWTLLAKDIDPGSVKQDVKRASVEAPTVRDLADEYLHRWARPRKSTWREDRRILEKDVLPFWENRKAADITRRDVIVLLDRIVDRGAPVAANRTLAVIRKMFNFGVGRDIVPASPCHAVPAPGKENKRDRVLSVAEIRAFWHGLDAARMSETSRLALKLQLATAQRIGEVARATWDELDLETGWWTIPAKRAKNRLPHRVPLSPLSLELLSAAQARSAQSPYVFPSPVLVGQDRNPRHRPVGPESLTRAVNRNIDVLGGTRFTPHDLRRTAASMMASSGVSRVVLKMILNHVDNDVTAIYDRHSYDPEKREALERWGERLASIVS